MTKIACQSKSYYNTLILIPENGKQVVITLHHSQFTWCPRNRALNVRASQNFCVCHTLSLHWNPSRQASEKVNKAKETAQRSPNKGNFRKKRDFSRAFFSHSSPMLILLMYFFFTFEKKEAKLPLLISYTAQTTSSLRTNALNT